ncbi:NAD-dependent formate dehydrogenase [Francisella tularensis]|uniref:NAD-dependent formate dehydrogenase n=1 Tax=Francisella tularensis TaxID=263 RepID=UPI000197A883|nr:NAD-dependent formate dehydrogenase [Francisella tularensis]ADA79353.1 formate dehydrogenase [Francisella tularensis subsp. tularensis NE061598]AFB79689.1 NAD-dependent formate dehydrogenase [Francisella tularensis subsp. tularensis TIGB03]AFB81233.1 NAD-dependent formate dehydrogenase [Francisella tularensis subsp. tularensis TI0902]AKZ20645.1 NAD-dependent formate dehydrogenase [Francisella tularensis subsp. tularensis MA00-2987]EKM84844.1 formate dehydrogenase [Francisella tularensis sub
MYSSLLQKNKQQEIDIMKILCVLYDDPKTGMPKDYPLAQIPKLSNYPDGSSLPTTQAIDFRPGELLGCVSGELGLRKFLEELGHELVVTSDKDGDGCKAEQDLIDADIVISQPFWPFYLIKERIQKAKKLKLAITAGIGSDHVDLDTAKEHKIDVVEVTYSNSISVSEHIVMMILSMVRDYLTQHEIAKSGGWNIADAVKRSYDLEGMNVGTVAAGRIGLSVLRKLKPFDTKLHYFDKYRLPKNVEQELNLIYS